VFFAALALGQIRFVVANKAGDVSIAHLQDTLSEGVEEGPVVSDGDNCALEGLKRFLAV
jgi:hypothetical protein